MQEAIWVATELSPAASAAEKSGACVMSMWQKLGPASLQPAAAVPPAVAARDNQGRISLLLSEDFSLPGEPMTKVLMPLARAALTSAMMIQLPVASCQ